MNEAIKKALEQLRDENTAADRRTSNWAPFIDRDYGERYLGGQPGFDIADPLDFATSAAASLYNITSDKVIHPALKMGVLAGDILNMIPGKNIKSQAEVEEFLDRYDPEGIVMRHHTYGGRGKDGVENPRNNPVIEYHDDNYNSFAGNYFVNMPAHNKFPRDPIGKQQASINVTPHSYKLPFDDFSRVMPGVAPITAAEEIEHAKRKFAGVSNRDWKGRPISRYLTTLKDETATKLTALKNVAKNEGLLEAAASVPGLLSTLSTYALPSKKDVGRMNVGKGLSGRRTYKSREMLDIITNLGYDDISEFEKDYGIKEGKDGPYKNKSTHKVPKKVIMMEKLMIMIRNGL